MNLANALDRFNEKWMPVTESGCHIWVGTISQNGYSRFWMKDKFIYGHRFIYEKTYGPILPGLQIDHLCRVRCCVNPEHMEAITLSENVLRGEGFTAKHAKKTHCMRGHEFSGKNLYIYSSGGRACKKCLAMHAALYRKRQKEKVAA